MNHVHAIMNRFDSNQSHNYSNIYYSFGRLFMESNWENACTCCDSSIHLEFSSGSPIWPGHLAVAHIVDKRLSRSHKFGRNVRNVCVLIMLPFPSNSDRIRHRICLSIVAHDSPEPDINIWMFENFVSMSTKHWRHRDRDVSDTFRVEF